MRGIGPAGLLGEARANRRRGMTILARLLPGRVAYGLRRARAAYLARRFAGMTAEEIFTRVYRENLWGGRRGEFHSGVGSSLALSGEYVRLVTGFVQEKDIRSVLDLGCGDFRVGRQLVSDAIDYLGVDVVPELIRWNAAVHGGERVRFMVADIVTGELPGADLVLVRQVLQHLSNEEIRSVLEKLDRYPYVLVTEHLPAEEEARFEANKEKRSGPDTRLNQNSGVVLGMPPFDTRAAEIVLTTRIPGGRRGHPEVLRTWLLTRGPVDDVRPVR